MPGLNEFVGQMRHELRNPVTAVLGYTQLLLEESEAQPLSDAVREHLAQVEAAGRRISQAIDEVLDPTRTPGGDIAEYAARVRHAVAAPVTTIQGSVELLLAEADTDSIAADLQRIHVAAERLIDLANGIEHLYRDGVRVEHADRQNGCSEAVQAAAGNAGPEATAGGVVLVIDDEETNRALLARRVERQGHRVLLAQ